MKTNTYSLKYKMYLSLIGRATTFLQTLIDPFMTEVPSKKYPLMYCLILSKNKLKNKTNSQSILTDVSEALT